MSRLIALLAVSLLIPWAVASATDDLVVREGLAIRTGGRLMRSAFRTDPIEARIVAGQWSAPREGESMTMPDGTNRTWMRVMAGQDGVFTNTSARGAYVYLPFVSATNGVLVLKASGH
ncbi:MAG: hypothetical protein FJ405_15680, partial [Verrucomicrobia bacterium]|nr:hypothetical protein [Verrucomicrobiota bacterium]